jgi:hypothetical protein
VAVEAVVEEVLEEEAVGAELVQAAAQQLQSAPTNQHPELLTL